VSGYSVVFFSLALNSHIHTLTFHAVVLLYCKLCVINFSTKPCTFFGVCCEICWCGEIIKIEM
jgi:hypothetical protein